MRHPRILRTVLAAVLVFSILPARQPAKAAAAAFSFSADKHSVRAGDTVSLKVKIRPGAPVAGFRLRVSFDSSVLQFAGTEPSAQMEPGTLRTNEASDPVCSVYVCNVNKGRAPQLSKTVLTYRFMVLGSASAGTTDLCACVDQACDFAGNDMALDTLKTFTLNLQSTPKQEEAHLTDLVPSAGTLEPAFARDIYDYRLAVGSEVRTVTFRTGAPDGCGVKASRYTLLAAGSQTPILVTVKSADGKAKSVYVVTVERAQKNTGGTASSASSSGTGVSKNSKTEQALTAAKKSTKISAGTGARSGGKARSGKPSASDGAEHASGGASGLALPAAAPLTIVESQMPPFFTGMLAAVLCMMTGLLLSLWFRRKKK